jgi:hypothetical protein
VVLDAVAEPAPPGLLAGRGEIVTGRIDVDRVTGTRLQQREVHAADAGANVEHD